MIALGITTLGWATIIMSIFVGTAGGYFIFKRFPNIFNYDRKINKIIKNPHLLLEKLKSHGKIYEEGENGKRAEIELKVEIDLDSGKEIIMIEKTKPKAKEIKKKVTEDKPKKKVKKKSKKRRREVRNK